MTSPYWVIDLRTRLPEDSWSWVLLALKQDQLVWQSLSNPRVYHRMVNIGSFNPEIWMPAQIGLISLKENINLADLRSDPEYLLPEHLHSTIDNLPRFSFEDHLEVDLNLACQYALAFWVGYNKKNSWEIVLDDISRLGQLAKSTLACLIGLIPDPLQLISLSLNRAEKDYQQLDAAIHAFLTIPASPEKQLKFLLELCQQIPTQAVISVIGQVFKHRPKLASLLKLEIGNEITSKPVFPSQRTLRQISQELVMYDLESITENDKVVTPVLEKALDLTDQLSGEIAYLLACSRKHDIEINMDSRNSTIALLKKALRNDPKNSIYLSKIVEHLIEEGKFDEAGAWIESFRGTSDDPYIQYQLANLSYRQGNIQEAIDYAVASLNLTALSQNDHQIDLLENLAALFLELDCPECSILTVKRILPEQPVNPRILVYLARARNNLGQVSEALEEIAAAFALYQTEKDLLDTGKKDFDIPTLFVNALEAAGEWRMALTERSRFHQNQIQPSMSSLNGLAHSALMAGEPLFAYDISEQALLKEPECDESLEIKGRACIELERFDEAIQYLQNASRISPLRVATWLALSNAYQKSKQPEKALDVLHAAVQAVPGSFLVQMGLGEYCVNHHAYTQAIAPLQKAAELTNNNHWSQQKTKGIGFQELTYPEQKIRLAINLAKAYKSVGRSIDSHHILEEAIQSIDGSLDQYPELILAYAQSLQEKGEIQLAIPLFECVIQTQPEDLNASIDLSQAFLDSSEQPSASLQAIPLLKSVINRSSDEAMITRAQILLADAFCLSGNYEESLRTYQSTMKFSHAKSLSWQSRISFGLGRANFYLNQFEAAVAAFLEAVRSNPRNPELQRWLAEVYLKLNLINDSYSSAQSFVQLRSYDPESILWFARISPKINALSNSDRFPIVPEAIHYLLKHIQKDPKKMEFWLRLGELQIIEKDLTAATEAYNQLAEMDLSQPEDITLKPKYLLEAGKSFVEIQAYQESAYFLEKAFKSTNEALNILKNDQPATDFASPSQILSMISDAYRSAGNYGAACGALRKMIQLEPEVPNSYSRLGNLLYEMGQTGDALGCFEKAIELDPGQTEFHQKIIWLYSVNGDLPSALAYSDKGIYQSDNQHNQVAGQQFRYLAAEISRSLLQFDRALEYLASAEESIDEISDEIRLLKEEIELEKRSDPTAINDETMHLIMNSPLHRSLMLKARLKKDQLNLTDISLLESLFEKPEFKTIPDGKDYNGLFYWKFLSSTRSLAEAALAIGHWKASRDLFRSMLKFSPAEPYAYLQLSRALVIQAERQNFANELDIVTQTPGNESVDDNAFQEFNQSIEKALRRLIDAKFSELGAGSQEEDDHTQQTLVHYWKDRGFMAFRPNQQVINKFTEIAKEENEVKAILLAQRIYNDDTNAVRLVQSLLPEKRPYLNLAMVLEKTRPWEALEITCQAIEKVNKSSKENNPQIALWYFLLSRLSNHIGGQNRLGIPAINAIEHALELIPEETHWHSIAAEYHLQIQSEGTGKFHKDSARHHLEIAIKQEPEYAYHHYALAKLLLSEAEIEPAILSLNKAINLAPHSTDIRLLLAKIQYENGDLVNAAKNADLVVEDSDENIDAYLLRGEIALMSGNPRGAQSRAQSILKINPDNLEAMQLLARSLNSLNRPNEALEIMAKVIPQVEKPLPLELERAQWLSETNPTTEAVIELRSLAQRYPQEPLFKAFLAETLHLLNQNEPAMLAARQALQDCDLGLPRSEQSKLHLIIGKNLLETGQLDSAIQHLNQAVEANPSNLEAHLELGKTHQARRNYQQASQIFLNATHVAPSDYRPYYFAGLAYKESKEYQFAEDMLRRALEISPGNITVRRQLGAVIALNIVHNRRSSIFHQQSK